MINPVRNAPRKVWLLKLWYALLFIAALGFTSVACLSYRFYISCGIDLEKAQEKYTLFTYYRFRWPDNGSLWIGAVTHYQAATDGPVEPFDLGGTWAYHTYQPPPRSFWNRIGFWWITQPMRDLETENRFPGPLWNFWIGMPSWLPGLMLGIGPVHWWIRQRRFRSLGKHYGYAT